MKKIYLIVFVFVLAASYAQTFSTKINNTLTECSCALSPWQFSGSSVASNSFSVNDSRHLYASDYGFSVPSGATIDGIEVSFNYSVNTAVTPTNTLRNIICMLMKGGASVGIDHSSSSFYYNTSTGVVNLGSSSDLWGTSLNAADVNSTNFGFDLKLNASVLNSFFKITNGILIRVYYTELSGIKESQISGSALYASGKKLYFDLNTNDNTKIEVFDLSGKKVFEETLQVNQNEIDLNSLNKGVYICKYKTTASEISRKIYVD